MKLAIFDIDGTLTDTNSVDGECFIAALAEAHAIRDVDVDWAAYPHTTDSGITLSIFQERFGRAPATDEVTAFKECFIRRLESQYKTVSAKFCQIAGAAEALGALRLETDWAVAIATGCWQASAELKLKAAGIETADVASAYAEDGLSREEILQAAVARVLLRYGQQGFEKIVSIGDGLWDVRAARRLEYKFLGVGDSEAAARLRGAGASHVIRDFADYGQFIKCLNEAEIPLSV